MKSHEETLLSTGVQPEYFTFQFGWFCFSYRSWQTLKFEKHPASFIRIVGTHNTANEVKTLFTGIIRLISALFL